MGSWRRRAAGAEAGGIVEESERLASKNGAYAESGGWLRS